MASPKLEKRAPEQSAPAPQSYFNSFKSSRGLETHKVETEDGYILSLFHLVGGKNVEEKAGECWKIPVLFMCGVLTDGTEWLIFEDEEKTLPNILAKEGYDCWMGSVRGSPHSRNHKTLKDTSKKFWDFCMDDHSQFDLPAIIDYVLKVTRQKDLFYIGFSLGGRIVLPMLCLKPEYSSKIRTIIGLAPAAYGLNFTHPFLRVMVPLGARLSLWRYLYRRRVGTNVGFSDVLKKWVPSCIKINQENLSGTCLKLAGRLTGSLVQGGNSDRSVMRAISHHVPASTSLKVLGHFAQVFHSKELRMYDYGRNGNIKRYGSPKPPLHDLSQISVPVATFAGGHDRLIPSAGVLRTSEELPNLISHTNISSTKFSHGDFLMGRDVHILVFPQIVDILRKYSTTQTPPTPSADPIIDCSKTPINVD